MYKTFELDGYVAEEATNRLIVNGRLFRNHIWPSLGVDDERNDRLEQDAFNRKADVQKLCRKRRRDSHDILLSALEGKILDECLDVFLQIQDTLPLRSMRQLRQEKIQTAFTL